MRVPANDLPDHLAEAFSSLIILNPVFFSLSYKAELGKTVCSGGHAVGGLAGDARTENDRILYSMPYPLPDGSELTVSFLGKPGAPGLPSREIMEAGAGFMAAEAIRRLSAAMLEQSEREGRESRELMRKMNSELSLAEERERKKIASDLHDHIGQALAMLKFRLAELRSNSVFCGFESHIEEMEKLLEHTIRYTRGLTVTISQPLLFEIGLAAALQWLAEDFAKHRGLPVKFEAADDGTFIPEQVKILIYKIAGELLSNGAKHAEANTVSLLLRIAEDRLTLDYTDNGRGFDPERTAREMADRNSWGLFSVRERVGFLGGAVKISSAPGSGTHISFQVPLPGGSGVNTETGEGNGGGNGR